MCWATVSNTVGTFWVSCSDIPGLSWRSSQKRAIWCQIGHRNLPVLVSPCGSFIGRYSPLGAEKIGHVTNQRNDGMLVGLFSHVL